MVKPAIDLMDHRTEKRVPVPPDVLAVVERANATLEGMLRLVHDLSLRASWCRFEYHPEWGWTVYLDIFTDEYGFAQQVRVEDLKDPKRTQEILKEVVWQFGRHVSDKVGEQIRKIRADLETLLAVGSE